ncbi:MAG TPA: hypothetical protein VGE30_01510 [Candidatus Saccharimonadales bacterium]
MHRDTTAKFNERIWDFYAKHGRHDLPWRLPEQDGRFDQYKILVSELMLQQTQVARVIPKFQAFLQRFPTPESLAGASLAEVLTLWSGLGYNRRAKFLWQAAQMIEADFQGTFPTSVEELTKLPGVGKNTAGAIAAYAFNQPALFIETNVRTVYIHHFFADQTDIVDGDIHSMLEATLDHENPREFYWAIMDYGTHLKQTVGNLGRHSKHYTKQSKFEGSRRQVRGQVLRELAADGKTDTELAAAIPDERLSEVLRALRGEQLIRRVGEKWTL